jgi:signal peptidase II
MPLAERLTTRPSKFSRVLWVVIAVLVLVLDQVSKAVVVRSVPEYTTIKVIPHVFNLINTTNTGAAFGLFSSSPAPWKTALLILASTALLALVISLMWQGRQFGWGTGVGLALILGGALSNLLDRIRLGRVVDFLDVYYRSYHWPTFNLADCTIVVGAGFLAFQLLFLE